MESAAAAASGSGSGDQQSSVSTPQGAGGSGGAGSGRAAAGVVVVILGSRDARALSTLAGRVISLQKREPHRLTLPPFTSRELAQVNKRVSVCLSRSGFVLLLCTQLGGLSLGTPRVMLHTWIGATRKCRYYGVALQGGGGELLSFLFFALFNSSQNFEPHPSHTLSPLRACACNMCITLYL